MYKELHKNGFMVLETAEQTYCEDDKLFLADRFVEGTCPNCGYDVSHPQLASRLISRMREAINATNAPSPFPPPLHSFILGVSGTRTTRSPFGPPPTPASASTSCNPN